MKYTKRKILQDVKLLLIFFIIALSAALFKEYFPINQANTATEQAPTKYKIETLNNNVPTFTQHDYDYPPNEYYAPLDDMGRCGQAFALVTLMTMPVEDRESISSVKPTGWHTYKSDEIDGGYLYNRCHLIAFCLTAENANPSNLVTGTRALNIDGMLPYELDVKAHVQNNDHAVLYRATPDFQGKELVCRGISLEAACTNCDYMFYVYCPNVQPHVSINYLTGEASGDILKGDD